jgi:phospholipid/cholesterol/gamma-HCH transport system substrate-binding protein
VVFLLVFALLIWFSLALYHKQFTPVSTVTLYTDSVGNEMHIGAGVMLRGVQVGEVRSISADGTGARLELAIQPGMVPQLPANVTAEMIPTTLFGERYVDLLIPAQPATARLTAGSVIRQDHSADAVEVEQVLNNLLPLLQASEPDKLSIILTAIAQGLQGRGKELGQTLVTLDSVLRRYNPHLAALDTDIRELAGVARTLNQASPSLLQALDDFTVTSRTLTSERASFAALYATVTTASNDLHAFVGANSGNIIRLSTDSTASLQILARYSPEFPCVLKDLVNFEPAANKLLGKGTKQPGLHVQANVVPEYVNARYLPNVDTPKYGDNLGPHCYSVPFKGITLNDGTSPISSGAGGSNGAASAGAGVHRSASAGAGVHRSASAGADRAASAGGAAAASKRRPLGPSAGVASRTAASTAQPRANGGHHPPTTASPQRPPWAGAAPTATTTAAAPTATTTAIAGSPLEGELVRELTGLALDRSPERVPAWSSLLLAPLFRGTTVNLVTRP